MFCSVHNCFSRSSIYERRVVASSERFLGDPSLSNTILEISKNLPTELSSFVVSKNVVSSFSRENALKNS